MTQSDSYDSFVNELFMALVPVAEFESKSHQLEKELQQFSNKPDGIRARLRRSAYARTFADAAIRATSIATAVYDANRGNGELSAAEDSFHTDKLELLLEFLSAAPEGSAEHDAALVMENQRDYWEHGSPHGYFKRYLQWDKDSRSLAQWITNRAHKRMAAADAALVSALKKHCGCVE